MEQAAADLRKDDRYEYQGLMNVYMRLLTKGSVIPQVLWPNALGRLLLIRKLHWPGKSQRQGIGIIRAGFPALAHIRLGFDDQLATVVDVVAGSGQLTGK